jgi:hypothetical protein
MTHSHRLPLPYCVRILSAVAKLIHVDREADRYREFYLCGVHPVALCTRISFKHIPAIATENLLFIIIIIIYYYQ